MFAHVSFISPLNQAFGLHIIEAFDSKPDSRFHHRITLRMLGKDTPDGLRGEVEAWCKGERQLVELPRLRVALAAMFLISIVERNIEAQHGILKRRIVFRRCKHVLCSMVLRMPLLKKLLRAKPYLKQKLFKHIENARNLSLVGKSLGVEGYLVSIPLRWKQKAFKEAVYRGRIKDQTADYSSSKKFNAKRAAAEEKLQEPEAKRRRRRQADQFNNMVTREWLAHLRAVVKRRDVVELPPDIANLTLLSSSARFSGTGKIAHAVEDSIVPEEPADGTRGADALAEPLYFRIVHAHPSSLKLIKPHLGSGRRILDDDMCITVHRRIGETDGHPFVSSQAVSLDNGRRILGGLRDSFSELSVQGLIVWTQSRPLQYMIRDAPILPALADAAQIACSTLVVNGAISAQSAFTFASSQRAEVDALQALSEHDLVANGGRPAGWYITPRGLKAMDFGNAFVSSFDATKPRTNFLALPRHDLTTFELMAVMDRNTWQWRKMPSERAQPEEFVFSIADLDDISEKIWYGAANRQYLLALLEADSNPENLHACGIVHVHHNKNQKYYTNLLRMVARAAAGHGGVSDHLDAIEDDLDKDARDTDALVLDDGGIGDDDDKRSVGSEFPDSDDGDDGEIDEAPDVDIVDALADALGVASDGEGGADDGTATPILPASPVDDVDLDADGVDEEPRRMGHRELKLVIIAAQLRRELI
jgi:hypothetical protein